MIQTLVALRKLRHSTVTIEANPELENYAVWVATRPIWVTWIILGIVVLIGLLQLMSGIEESIRAAGLEKSEVRHGQWWRLLTGPLLHGSVLHLTFNGLALIGLGRLMEVLASRFHLIITFIFAALCGSIASFLLLPHTNSIGASGGILGLLGFLLALGYRRKEHLPPGFARSIKFNVLLIAIMGICAYSIIDNAAHLGGFLGGFALGLILIKRGELTLPLSCGPALRAAGITALLLQIGFAGVAVYRILGR